MILINSDFLYHYVPKPIWKFIMRWSKHNDIDYNVGEENDEDDEEDEDEEVLVDNKKQS